MLGHRYQLVITRYDSVSTEELETALLYKQHRTINIYYRYLVVGGAEIYNIEYKKMNTSCEQNVEHTENGSDAIDKSLVI